jgi:hypothetical protein
VRLRRLIHARVDPVAHRQVQQEAAARRVSMTACAGDLLREYFALREEMASGGAALGQPSDRYRGLIDSFLTRSEERLRATLEGRTREVSARLQRVELVLDWLVRFLAFYTLDIPVQYRADAAAAADLRYRKCLRFVEERLATASPGAAGHGGSRAAGESSGKGPGPGPGASEPAPDALGGPAGRPAPCDLHGTLVLDPGGFDRAV